MNKMAIGRPGLARRAVLGAALALPMLGLAHAQPAPADWAGVLANARKQGQVTVYSAQVPPLLARMAAAFRKAYPDIALTVLRGPSGELLTKVEQERAAGIEGADILISTEMAWFQDQAKNNRLLAPRGPSRDAWPAKYLWNGAIVVGGIEPLVIPYNTDLVKTPPHGYQDLLNPAFKDRFGGTELAATTLVAYYDWLEKTQGADYLRRMKALNPKMYVGASPISQALASGEIAAAIFVAPTAMKPLMQQGAPIGFVVPDPAFGIQYGAAAFGWSKHPDAALVFIDFLTSRDGQTAWHGTGESASPLAGIPGALQADKVQPWDPAQYPPDVVRRYTEHWNSIFK